MMPRDPLFSIGLAFSFLVKAERAQKEYLRKFSSGNLTQDQAAGAKSIFNDKSTSSLNATWLAFLYK